MPEESRYFRHACEGWHPGLWIKDLLDSCLRRNDEFWGRKLPNSSIINNYRLEIISIVIAPFWSHPKPVSPNLYPLAFPCAPGGRHCPSAARSFRPPPSPVGAVLHQIPARICPVAHWLRSPWGTELHWKSGKGPIPDSQIIIGLVVLSLPTSSML